MPAALTRSTRAALGLVAVAVAVAGCTSRPAAAERRPSPSPTVLPSTPAPPPTATPPAPGDVDPLTGLAPRPDRPVVVVKVDNETLAWPYQRGLDHAALVYQELMEGGSTRLAAVFDNGYPGEVGPIRSFRESDVGLLRQLGRVGIAFSGANRGVLHSFRQAVSAGLFLDASYYALPGDYRIGEHRPDANNFFARPARLAADLPAAATARDIGLRFGPVADATGHAATAARAEFAPGSVVTVRYDPPHGGYAVTQTGHPMPGVHPVNVIVQRVLVTGSSYVDVLGHGTPYTETVGGGSALLLRDGQAFDIRWRRARATLGTHFVDDAGHDVPLHPGSTWVLLLPQGNPLTVS